MDIMKIEQTKKPLKALHRLQTIEETRSFTEDNHLAFLYVAQEGCSVCHALLPKLRLLLEPYPEIALAVADAQEVPQVASDYQIFSAPALLLFVEGRVYIREGRFVQFQKLAATLERLILFERSSDSADSPGLIGR